MPDKLVVAKELVSPEDEIFVIRWKLVEKWEGETIGGNSYSVIVKKIRKNPNMPFEKIVKICGMDFDISSALAVQVIIQENRKHNRNTIGFYWTSKKDASDMLKKINACLKENNLR